MVQTGPYYSWTVLLCVVILFLYFLLFADKQEKKTEREKAVARESERLVGSNNYYVVDSLSYCSCTLGTRGRVERRD